jgi:hypothetical protein
MHGTRSLVWIAGLAGVLAGASLAMHRRNERERRVSPAKPEPVQTWEGEGGAVPLRTGRTAQQVTPSSADVSAVGTQDGLPGSEPQPQELTGGPRYDQGGQPH